jgi:hypothetical protein
MVSTTASDRLGRAAIVFVRALPAVLAALVVVIVDWPGLMPGVGFWDTGEFQTVLPILGTAHPTGYPTYVILGFIANLLLAPLGEPAFRITVLSLLATAVAAAMTVVLVGRLTRMTILGVAAGLGLALTPIVWSNATRADPHPIHLMLVAILFVLLVAWSERSRAGRRGADRWLVAATVVYGLAVGNHSLSLLLAPPIGLFVLAVEPRIVLRPRLVAACALVLLTTVVVLFLELPLRAGPLRAPLVYGHPETWDGFWYVVLAEQFRGSLSDPLGDLPHKLAVIGQVGWSQFGILAYAIPLGFLATVIRRPRYALLSGLAMVITLVFDASYANADISRYYLGPALWAWTWLAVGVGAVVEAIAGRRWQDGPLPGRLLAGALVLALLVPSVGDLPARRAQADRHLDTEAGYWLSQVLPALAPDAVVVSWWSTSTPLWYAKYVLGERPDIDVVDDRTMLDLDLGGALDVIDRYLGTRPVYVIRANGRDLAEVMAAFVLVPAAGNGGNTVYLVTGRRGA